jgi:hypothetical protein
VLVVTIETCAGGNCRNLTQEKDEPYTKTELGLCVWNTVF